MKYKKNDANEEKKTNLFNKITGASFERIKSSYSNRNAKVTRRAVTFLQYLDVGKFMGLRKNAEISLVK